MDLRYIIICLLFSFLSSQAQLHSPFRHVEQVSDGVLVTYLLDKGLQSPNNQFKGSYSWNIPGFGVSMTEGLPEVSQRWDTFLIPEGKSATVELVSASYRDTCLILSPASRPRTIYDSCDDKVLPIKPYLGWYPKQPLQLGRVQYYRGQGMVSVCVMPLQYDNEHNIVRYYTRLCYKVSFQDVSTSFLDSKQLDRTARRNLFNPNAGFFQNVALNCLPSVTSVNATKAVEFNSREDLRDYLIVYPKTFVKEIDDFVRWKKTQGFCVKCVAVDTLVNVSIIEDTIKNFYRTAENPYYLLFIGDAHLIPQYPFSVNSDSNKVYYSDRPYVMMDDNDNIPDLSYGRIPARTKDEVIEILQKIMHYEQNPCTDKSFYDNATCVAVYQARGGESNAEFGYSAEVSEQIRTSLVQNKKEVTRIYSKAFLDGSDEGLNPFYYYHEKMGFHFVEDSIMPSYLRRPEFLWDGTSEDVISRLNEGTFLTTALVHCKKDTLLQQNLWISPSVTSQDVMGLTNHEKQTILFSPACDSGRFDDDDNWPACAFLRNPNGGAVGVFAPCDSPFMGYSDALMEGCINAIWPSPGINPLGMHFDESSYQVPMYELGDILQYGGFWMSQFCEQSNSLEYPSLMPDNCSIVKGIFHCLGDSSMQIVTESPRHFAMPTIRREGEKLIVKTKEDDVRISFCDMGTDVLSSVVGNYCEIAWDDIADSGITLCLTKHNYIPYILDFGQTHYMEEKTISGLHVYWSPDIFYVGCGVVVKKSRLNL